MLENEAALRLGTFFGSIIIMLCWQLLMPRRETSLSLWQRGSSNFGLIAISWIILRFLLPIIAVTNVAALANQNQWGLFQHWQLPQAMVLILSLIILDCLIYWQHRLFHKYPLLWRLHRVHHSDKELDTSSGVRFHPIEIILSILIKSAAVILFGIPVIAVLVFEIVLNAMSIFNHSNVYINERVDRLLRYLIVTPDMHRIHHSTLKPETNSNYGFSTSVWDRLFKSYTDQPKDGQLNMQIGLDDIPQSESIKLIPLLLQPFKNFTKHQEPS